MLSECIINPKTIFSFNFQENAIKIYKGILEQEISSIIRQSLLSSLLMSLGTFVTFICEATVFKCSFIFMKNQTLTYRNMNLNINTLLTINGMTLNLLAIAEFPKAKLAFIVYIKF